MTARPSVPSRVHGGVQPQELEGLGIDPERVIDFTPQTIACSEPGRMRSSRMRSTAALARSNSVRSRGRRWTPMQLV
jgi:hypothetical protein